MAWPRTSKEAKALFDRLPRVIDGHRGTSTYGGVDTADAMGPMANADYGRFASVTVMQEFVDKSGARKGVAMPARDLLSAQFGLVFGCAPHSYRGTIPSVDHGFRPGRAKPTVQFSWFFCRIDGAEGDDNFKADALGWISGPTAWQLVASDQKSLRVMLDQLHRAQP